MPVIRERADQGVILWQSGWYNFQHTFFTAGYIHGSQQGETNRTVLNN